MNTVVPLKTDDTEQLIREGAALERKIKDQQERLREINSKLAERAEFKPGSATGYLVGACYKVKIQRKEYIRWDQKRLLQIKPHLGDDFDKLFRAEYKHQNKKVLDAFLEFAEEEPAKAVRWAMMVKPGAPSVSYVPLEVEHGA